MELGRLLHGKGYILDLLVVCLLVLFSMVQLYHQRELLTFEVKLTAFFAPLCLAACILEQPVLSQLCNTFHQELLGFFLLQ